MANHRDGVSRQVLEPEALKPYNEKARDGLALNELVPFGCLKRVAELRGRTLTPEDLMDICGLDKEAPPESRCVFCPEEEPTIVRFWSFVDQNGFVNAEKWGNFVVRRTGPDQWTIFCGCGLPNDGSYDLESGACSHLWLLRYVERFDVTSKGEERLIYNRREGQQKPLPCHNWKGALTRQAYLESIVEKKKAEFEEKKRRQEEILRQIAEQKKSKEEYARRQGILVFGTEEAQKILGIEPALASAAEADAPGNDRDAF